MRAIQSLDIPARVKPPAGAAVILVIAFASVVAALYFFGPSLLPCSIDGQYRGVDGVCRAPSKAPVATKPSDPTAEHLFSPDKPATDFATVFVTGSNGKPCRLRITWPFGHDARAFLNDTNCPTQPIKPAGVAKK